jgi:hypothetical protein
MVGELELSAEETSNELEIRRLADADAKSEAPIMTKKMAAMVGEDFND